MIPEGYTVHCDGSITGKNGKLRKPSLIGNRDYKYLGLGVQVEGKTRWAYVHVLVCEAFHGAKPFPEAQVRHLDGNPLNNNAHNLKWGTPAENSADTKRHGRHRNDAHPGEKNGRAVLTEQQVREIRTRYAAGGVFQRELGEEYGVSTATISHVISGRNWKYTV